MRNFLTILICVLAARLFAQQPGLEEHQVRFRAVDIFVDSTNAPLAAYQLEFNTANSVAKIVGIEGGEHPAFHEPPYYDKKALQHERVVIAAFSTYASEHLPTGKTRLATIHLQTIGSAQPIYTLKLQTAADSQGNRIRAAASFEERTTR